MPNFIEIDEHTTINLDLVVSVEPRDDGTCAVLFADGRQVTFGGVAAIRLLEEVGHRASQGDDQDPPDDVAPRLRGLL